MLTANAPLSMPARKTKPSLVYPVELTHSFQTDALVAYPLPETPGMTAQTMMEIRTPAKRKNKPACSIFGNTRLANKTIAVKTQVAMTYVTNTCHRSVTKPGWDTEYMLVTRAERICTVEARPKIHARKFHHPAKKPTQRPCRPAVTVAQW